MFRSFAIFRLFDLFRTPSGAEYVPVDPGDVPATALITADGIPLQTADGEYLTTEA
jgi:hypothetical protein